MNPISVHEPREYAVVDRNPGQWVNRLMVAEAMERLQSPSKQKAPETVGIASLTARERAVVMLIGKGLRNKEIAKRLTIAEKTVRHYLTSIFEKVGVGDRLELMIFAYQNGLARLPAPQDTAFQERVLDIYPTKVPDKSRRGVSTLS